MKSSPAFCLVVLAITLFAQFGACYPIGVSQSGEEMLMDNGGIGEQNGSVVNITEPGIYEVFLERNDLDFKVCSMTCNADFLVCYNSDSANQTVLEECDSKCGFYVNAKENYTSVMRPIKLRNFGRVKQEVCDIFTMINGKISFGKKKNLSCAPKIENGIVKLNVTTASFDCPVSIKNAHLVPEATTAPPTTTTPKSANLGKTSTTKSGASGANNGTTTDSPTFMASYWWVFLIVGIIILAGIAIGLLVYCFVFKKEKKPTIVSPAVERRLKRPKTKIVAPPAAEEEPKEDGKRSKLPSSILDPSSILSQKSLLDINRKEPQQQLEPKKEEAQQPSVQPSTDLKSVV